MNSEDRPDASEFRWAADHAWQWFSLHAAQRLRMFNFWLISVAFLTAAYVTALTNQKPQIALAIAGAGTVLTRLFRRLELRTRQLVHLGERALGQFEARVADVTGIHEIQLLSAAESEKRRFSSYGAVISAMQAFVTIAFLIAVAYAIVKWG
jgi:hypothetical protein